MNPCAGCINKMYPQYLDQWRETGAPAPQFCAHSRAGGIRTCDPTRKHITIPLHRVSVRLLGSSAAASLAGVVPSAITNAVKRGTLVPDAEMVVPTGTRPLFEERTIVAWRDLHAIVESLRKEDADETPEHKAMRMDTLRTLADQEQR